MNVLFKDSNHIKLTNADLSYYPNFYSKDESKKLFQVLKNSIDWQMYDIKVFGRTYKQPRLTAFYNNSKLTLIFI